MTIPELRELGYTFTIRPGYFLVMREEEGSYGKYMVPVACVYGYDWTLDKTMEQARLKAVEHFVLGRLTA